MNLTLQILKSRIHSLNRYAHSEKDFHRIRRKLNIAYYEIKQTRPGYYVCDKAGDFIFIDSRIGGLTKSEVQFHELVHAVLHYPCEFLARKHQIQAEIFALILMIPKKDLFTYSQMSFDEIDYRLIPYLKKRKYIFEVFGV